MPFNDLVMVETYPRRAVLPQVTMHRDRLALQRTHIVRGHADMQYGICRHRFVRDADGIHLGWNIFIGTIGRVLQRGFMHRPSQHGERSND